MTNTNKLIESLVGYVKNVKPYHSKLRDFTSELFFNDKINAAVVDAQPQLHLSQSDVWTRLQDERLARLSEGLEADRVIDIPKVLIPRFSLNSFLNTSQTPLGTDPASLNLTDNDNDGKPDAEVPYNLPVDPDGWNHLSQSRRSGSDTSPLELSCSPASYSLDSTSDNGSTMTYTAQGTCRVDVTGALAFGISTNDCVVTVQFRWGSSLTVPGFITHITTATDDYYQLSFKFTSTFLKTDYPEPTTPGILDSHWCLGAAHAAKIQANLQGDTGRYKVPFHTGSYVEVDGVAKTLAVDYTVDSRQSAIQFLAGKHPAPTAMLAFNLFKSDRMYMAMASPFTYDYASNGSPADAFVVTVDSLYFDGYEPIVFTNQEPGSVKCELRGLKVSGSDGDTWTITAIGEYTLKIEQTAPATTLPQYAFLNQPFDNGQISFTLSAPWIDYYFDLQTGSYADLIDLDPSLNDRADYFPPVASKTAQSAISFNPVGIVKQRLDGSYYLELVSTPPRGTYIEVRIEHSVQYNPRAAAGVDEGLKIVVFTDEELPGEGPNYDDGGFGSPAFDSEYAGRAPFIGAGDERIVFLTTYVPPPPTPTPDTDYDASNFDGAPFGG